jgi:hypothetical protein
VPYLQRVKDVFLVSGRGITGDYFNVYLIKAGKQWTLVNSGSVEVTNLVLNNVLEITKGEAVENLILTSCSPKLGDSASVFYSIFSSKIIAHFPDSVEMRMGRCSSSPIPVNIEVRDSKFNYGEFQFLQARTPTKGAMIVFWRDKMFTGLTKSTPFHGKAKFVCDVYDCIEVR